MDGGGDGRLKQDGRDVLTCGPNSTEERALPRKRGSAGDDADRVCTGRPDDQHAVLMRTSVSISARSYSCIRMEEGTMPDSSGPNVLHEAGAAIGNIGRRLLNRRRPRYSEEALARWLRTLPMPDIPFDELDEDDTERATIDGTFRVLEENEGETR